MNYAEQLEKLEEIKNAGMDSGELSFETVLEILGTEDYNLAGALHARAAAYCFGEYVANYYETPKSERPSYNPYEYFVRLFELDKRPFVEGN